MPNEIPWEAAVTLEPLACGIHGVERANIQFGETAVLTGCGPIGLLMLQAAKLKNPMQLIAVDTDEHRLEIAKETGADLVINPAKEDVVAKVKSLTGGIGCDVVLEASGSPKAVVQAVDMLRRGGTADGIRGFRRERPAWTGASSAISKNWKFTADIWGLILIPRQ